MYSLLKVHYEDINRSLPLSGSRPLKKIHTHTPQTYHEHRNLLYQGMQYIYDISY